MILSVVEVVILCFFFNDTATTEIYTLSLHDALPISQSKLEHGGILATADRLIVAAAAADLLEAHRQVQTRSEEHTSELQSRLHLVCRLLLEKKKHHIRPERLV